jgi:hypothetical protein
MIKEFSYQHNEFLPQCPFFGISFEVVKWGKNHKYICTFLGSEVPDFLGKTTILEDYHDATHLLGDLTDDRLVALACVAKKHYHPMDGADEFARFCLGIEQLKNALSRLDRRT